MFFDSMGGLAYPSALQPLTKQVAGKDHGRNETLRIIVIDRVRPENDPSLPT
jgi:hypothetical protein